jgi:hypothetical protein
MTPFGDINSSLTWHSYNKAQLMMLGTVSGIMEVVGSRLCLALMLFIGFLSQIGVALVTLGLVTCTPIVV